LFKHRPWEKTRTILAVIENLIYIVTYGFFIDLMYSVEKTEIKSGFYFFVPLMLAAFVDLVLVKFEESPCNSSFYVMSRMLSGLRLLFSFSITMKIGNYSSWSWSTTFWPYWCSFAIMGILGIASVIMLFSSIVNYCKGETVVLDSKSFHSLLIFSYRVFLVHDSDVWFYIRHIRPYHAYSQDF
jgi:hypothetical protein